MAIGIETEARQRTRSLATITYLRFQRSTSTPAGIASTRYGRRCAKMIKPACRGELVNASMRNGRANPEIWVPSKERAWPAHSGRKSRLYKSVFKGDFGNQIQIR